MIKALNSRTIPEPGSAELAAIIDYCNVNKPRLLAMLPMTAGEIVEGTGSFERLFELVRQRGGGRVRIGTTGRCQLTEGMAEKNADRLILRAQIFKLELPSAGAIMAVVRRAALEDAIKAGGRAAEIAAAFAVSERHVFKVAKRMRECGR